MLNYVLNNVNKGTLILSLTKSLVDLFVCSLRTSYNPVKLKSGNSSQNSLVHAALLLTSLDCTGSLSGIKVIVQRIRRILYFIHLSLFICHA